MAASMPVGFDSWLSVKLKALNTDESVFGFYIKGILEGEESQDEKIEALEGILAEISPVNEDIGLTNTLCFVFSSESKVAFSNKFHIIVISEFSRMTAQAKVIFVKKY